MKEKKKFERRKKNAEKNALLKKRGLPKDRSRTVLNIFGPQYFLNYELSWLKFNERVLAEAQSSKNKILDRVKFISIVCSNLDEFFQKRVGGLKRQQMAGVKELTVDGRNPREQLQEVRSEVLKMITAYRACYFNKIIPKLADKGIHIKRYEELSEDHQHVCDQYFEQLIYSLITPLAIDESHPFPFISNKSTSFIIELLNPKTNKASFARIKIPDNRKRFVEVHRRSKNVTFVAIEDIIRQKLGLFFPGMEIQSAHLFRITRNASIERNEEEAEDLLEVIEDELRERKFAEIVRLEAEKEMPEHIMQYLVQNLQITEDDVYKKEGTIGLADVMEIANIENFSRQKEEPWTPVLHPALKHGMDETPSIFDIIKKGDFLVHHPYHSFKLSTQHFIDQAARDPKVLAIKQTLYRTSKDSPLMHSLMSAADEGKQVAVLVEIKARFDEERNINWAQKLENVGVHVAYGIPGLKIHTKLTMVVREERNGLRTYCHIGTGNYHPGTAQLYEDLALFTCNKDICEDVAGVFNSITGHTPSPAFKKLLVAPNHMREQLNDLIDFEIKQAKKNKPARIIAKMNGLTDPLIIQKLYEASAAGVKIYLIVRGVCQLIPGKKGLSENIAVHSVIGRFLEHSRVYYFHHSGEDHFFIGSADWMHRNLDARVEAITPVESPSLKQYLKYALNIYLADNKQRWTLRPDGTYQRVKRGKGEPKIGTHAHFMHHIKNTQAPIPVHHSG